MPATRVYDLAVKVGEYTDNNGNTKGRYKNCGAVLEKDGRQFMLLDKTFNPAGVPDEKGGDSIIVSMFTPKGQEGDAPVIDTADESVPF